MRALLAFVCRATDRCPREMRGMPIRSPVTCLGVAICLAISVHIVSCAGYIADGAVDERLQFQTVDGTTGLPIAGATVVIWDSYGTGVESPPAMIEHATVEGATDKNGLLTLECRMPCSTRHHGCAIDKVISVSDSLWLIVDREGYDSKRLLLSTLVGRKHSPGDLPLPPIRIAISPEGRTSTVGGR
jgi:hypothetical protein